MQHLDELRDGRLGIILGVIVAPGNLQGRSFEELAPGVTGGSKATPSTRRTLSAINSG